MKHSYSCYIICSICILFVCFFTSIQMVCFSPNFYQKQYQKLDLATQLHTTHENLMKATTTLLDYIQAKKENIDVTIERYEIAQPAFHEREYEHMKDVKNLYQNARMLYYFSIGWIIFTLIVYRKSLKKEQWNTFFQAFFQVFLCLSVMFTFLIFWSIVDFTSLWDFLHQLFFKNLLWMMNPNTDFMINLFPESVFAHMIFKIVTFFILSVTPILSYCIYRLKKQNYFLS